MVRMERRTKVTWSETLVVQILSSILLSGDGMLVVWCINPEWIDLSDLILQTLCDEDSGPASMVETRIFIIHAHRAVQ